MFCARNWRCALNNPREMLARCAPGATGYEPRGGRDYKGITAADMAAAVAKITDPTGQMLVLFMWADYVDYESGLIHQLLVPASTLCVERGWEVRRPGLLSGILRAALYELKHPRICYRCNGSGVRAGVECDACAGRRWVPMSDMARAVTASIPYEAWRRWAGRYADFVAMVDGIEREAVRQMRRAIGS